MYKKLLTITTLFIFSLFLAPTVSARNFNFEFKHLNTDYSSRVFSYSRSININISTTGDGETSISIPKPTSTPKPTPTPAATPTATPTSTPGPIGGPSNANSFNRALVTLTLDDASQSQFLNAWPIMQKYGMRGTFYITTLSLDGFWYMIPDQIKQLYNGGNHIAAHTITHVDLTTVSSSQLTNELADPQNYLQGLIGAPVRDFATPFGTWNNAVLNQIKQYYRSHRGVQEGFNTKQTFNIYNLLVQNVYNTTTASQINNWVDQAKQNNSWLILVYHQVIPNPGQYDVSPQNFDAQLNAIQSSGVSVVTLDQAINELLPQL